MSLNQTSYFTPNYPNLNVSGAITAANIAISNNLSVAGTLTTVNMTTTNLIDTNITAGAANITNATIATARITSNLLAVGNSNTLGNLFTTGGNVGIGTTAPAAQLHISGSAGNAMFTSYNGANMQIATNIGSFASIEAFTTGNTAKLPLLLNAYGGNVGIGTTSPTAQLNVGNDFSISANNGSWNSSAGKGIFMRYSTNGVQDAAYIQSIDRSANITYPLNMHANSFQFSLIASLSPVMTIASTGNVGIGMATPLSILHVQNSGNTTSSIMFSHFTATGTFPGQQHGEITFQSTQRSLASAKIISRTTTTGSLSGWDDCGNLEFLTSSGGAGATQRMTITESGNVGIGTNAPAYTLDVAGTFRCQNQPMCYLLSTNTSGSTNNYGPVSWTSATYNYGNMWSSGTNITAPVTGIYQLTFRFHTYNTSNIGAQNITQTGIVNRYNSSGTLQESLNNYQTVLNLTANYDIIGNHSLSFFMNANDYIQLSGACTMASSWNFGGAWHRITVTLIRAI